MITNDEFQSIKEKQLRLNLKCSPVPVFIGME